MTPSPAYLQANKQKKHRVAYNGLHASCFARFDPIGCVFKNQAGGRLWPWLKAFGSMQEDVGSRLAILYHVTCINILTVARQFLNLHSCLAISNRSMNDIHILADIISSSGNTFS